MQVKYTGQTAPSSKAMRSRIDAPSSFERYPRDRHAPPFLVEARRMSATHWQTAITPQRDLLGEWFINRDYAEALKLAAANMTMAMQERGAV